MAADNRIGLASMDHTTAQASTPADSSAGHTTGATDTRGAEITPLTAVLSTPQGSVIKKHIERPASDELSVDRLIGDSIEDFSAAAEAPDFTGRTLLNQTTLVASLLKMQELHYNVSLDAILPGLDYAHSFACLSRATEWGLRVQSLVTHDPLVSQDRRLVTIVNSYVHRMVTNLRALTPAHALASEMNLLYSNQLSLIEDVDQLRYVQQLDRALIFEDAPLIAHMQIFDGLLTQEQLQRRRRQPALLDLLAKNAELDMLFTLADHGVVTP